MEAKSDVEYEAAVAVVDEMAVKNSAALHPLPPTATKTGVSHKRETVAPQNCTTTRTSDTRTCGMFMTTIIVVIIFIRTSITIKPQLGPSHKDHARSTKIYSPDQLGDITNLLQIALLLKI